MRRSSLVEDAREESLAIPEGQRRGEPVQVKERLQTETGVSLLRLKQTAIDIIRL